MESRNRLAIRASCDELWTGLSVLETGILPAGCATPHATFALTAHPEAQVVVELGATRDFWFDLSSPAKTYHVVFY